MLQAHWCLAITEQYLRRVTAISVSPAAPVPGARWHKKFAWNTAGTSEPNQPKAYSTPYDAILNHLSWGKKEKGGNTRHDSIWLPKSLLNLMKSCISEGLHFLEMARNMPVKRTSWIDYTFCFACCSALPFKLSLSQGKPIGFPTFAFLILSPPHCKRKGEDWAACGRVRTELPARINPQLWRSFAFFKSKVNLHP